MLDGRGRDWSVGRTTRGRGIEDPGGSLARSLEAPAGCISDPVGLLIRDREVHVSTYRECGNPLLADIVTDLYTYLMDHRRRSVAQPGAIGESFSDQRAILAALKARSREGAIAAFAAHEERIYASTKRLLAQDAAAATRASGAVPDAVPPGRTKQ